MNHFHRQGKCLWAEGVPLTRIAQEVSTPTYVYSAATLRRHLALVQAPFQSVPTIVSYSVKPNPTPAVLPPFGQSGPGFDIVSHGDLARVLRPVAHPTHLLFS